MNSRLLEQIQYIYFLGEIIEEKKPDAVFFCGDFVEAKGVVKPSVIIPVIKEFKKVIQDISFYCIPGNHDKEDFNGLYNVVDLFNIAFDEAITPSNHYTIADGILMIPYKKYKKDFLNILKEQHGNYNIILSHQGLVREKKFDKNDIFVDELRDVISDDIYVFNGHYHIPFKDGNIFNVGASMKHDFNDVDRDALTWYVDLADGSYDVYPYNDIDFVNLHYGSNQKTTIAGKYVKCFVSKEQKEEAQKYLEQYAKDYLLDIVHKKKQTIKKKNSVNIDDIIISIIKKNYDEETANNMLNLFHNIKKG